MHFFQPTCVTYQYITYYSTKSEEKYSGEDWTNVIIPGSEIQNFDQKVNLNNNY